MRTSKHLGGARRLPAALQLTALAVAFGLLAACAGQGGTGAASGGGDSAAGLVGAGSSALKAATLSDAEIKELSDKSCAALDAKATVAAPKSKEAARLAKLAKALPAAVNGVPVNYKVYLTDEVNAWAMGNGCVRVYGGLMKLMNDDELRGVIGHELGHVALGHAKASLQTAYAASAARQAAAAAGPTAAALSNSQLGDLAEKLVNAQFSQAQESAADDYSFDLLTAARLKREGLVTAFEKLAKQGERSSLFSSHPPSSERAQHIRERLARKK